MAAPNMSLHSFDSTRDLVSGMAEVLRPKGQDHQRLTHLILQLLFPCRHTRGFVNLHLDDRDLWDGEVIQLLAKVR